MELEVEGGRPVGRPKKTCQSKLVEGDMRKLNIIKEATHQLVEATHITSNPRSGKLGMLNEDDDVESGENTVLSF